MFHIQSVFVMLQESKPVEFEGLALSNMPEQQTVN
jgi:hypothetical protein